MLEVTQVAGGNNIRVPSELTMLGKTLLNLDQVGRAIAPEFDPNASIRRNAAQIMQQRLVKSLSPGNLFSGVLELKDLLQRLPTRINKILDAIAENKLKVEVDAIDEKTLIVGFQKVANRITTGLVIASLIVGAGTDDARGDHLPHLGLSWARDSALPRGGRGRRHASGQHPFLRQVGEGLSARHREAVAVPGGESLPKAAAYQLCHPEPRGGKGPRALALSHAEDTGGNQPVLLRFDDRGHNVLRIAGVDPVLQAAMPLAIEHVDHGAETHPDEESNPGQDGQAEHQRAAHQHA